LHQPQCLNKFVGRQFLRNRLAQSASADASQKNNQIVAAGNQFTGKTNSFGIFP